MVDHGPGAGSGPAALGVGGTTAAYAQAPAVSGTGPAPLSLDLLSPFRHYPAPGSFAFQGRTLVAEYARDSLLSSRVDVYLHRYRPETAVVLACDLRTGKLLAMGERSDSAVTASPRLAFAGGFPAASLIKILTAAAALELKVHEVTDSIPQVGSYHTLYRRQLRPDDRWAGKVTLQEAFSKSVNPAFGLLGISLGADALRRYAERLGFNRASPPSCVAPSVMLVPDTGFALAEAACGFTSKTTISPWHALELARALGDDGVLRPCALARSLRDPQGGEVPLHGAAAPGTMVSAENLAKLQAMMQATVRSGTARKGFHSVLRAAQLEKIEVGGKTGSLDGELGTDSAKGRFDWFIGYARLKEDPAHGMALCVMLVHKEYRATSSAQFSALLVRDWLAAEIKARKIEAAPHPASPPGTAPAG